MSKGLRGIPASRGLARGVSLHWRDADFEIPNFIPADLEAERNRLTEARQEAESQLYAIAEKITRQAGDVEAALFEAQAMFLNDTVLVTKAENTIEAGVNAEQAWHQACKHFATQLESLPDETLRARSADVLDVGRRVIEILLGIQAGTELASQAIILARDLAPSQTASLDTSKVLAFCTAEGGPTSHTAILARALGIPAVVGIGDGVLEIPDGSMLLVDGITGLIVPNPTPDLLADFDRRIQAEREKQDKDAKIASQPAVTTDGHRIEVVANIGGPEDARKALANGAEGIGLLRTEFLFINRSQVPDEETQFAAYKTILDLMESRPVVVRTLDVGGDKEVPYYDFGTESNPFLGYRAIRISLDQPEEFNSQLRALLRAGVGHDLRIMFPMITTLEEVRQAKRLFEKAQNELQVEQIEKAEKVQIGIMVETPAVTLMSEKFASEVDFFSIGTNDLTQYTFAAERGNKRVSHLNDPCHPAVLRQIEKVVRAAHEKEKWVGVCGEMAGDPGAIPLLLGLEVDELSISPAQIPSAKEIIRRCSYIKTREIAQQALEMESAEVVRQAVNHNLFST